VPPREDAAEVSGPLTFVPILKEKVWGGRALQRWGRTLPDGAFIGESWELVDLDATSPSGGGGAAAVSVVAEGPHCGATIHDLLRRCGPAILGADATSPRDRPGERRFPLLCKLLDAREPLSVQTHPSPAYAAAHPDAHLKTETWFVLEAEPDAAIYAGLAPGVQTEDLPAAAARGTIEPLLRRLPVRAGDCVHLPSGVLHALGAGVVVAEVQTPSDTTFRLYDWGRPGRQMHIEQCMACIDESLRPTPTRAPDDAAGRWTLARTEAYTLDLLRLEAASSGEPLARDARPWCVLAITGEVEIHTQTERRTLAPGGFALVPANLHDAALASPGPSEILCIGVGAER